MQELGYRKKVTIMVAIMAALLFAALNQTIIGTALPHIITDLGGRKYFSWVFPSYILAAVIPAVIVGRLSDSYGRRPFILLAIAIFVVGALLSGLANNSFELILFRMIQGVGGGAIIATSFSAIGDLFVPRERGLWQGLLGATFALAIALGPALGGFIVEHWPWQWGFWVFAPPGMLAFITLWWLLPSTPDRREPSIDYLGAALLTATLMPLLLAFNWAGHTYAWGSPQIIALLIASVISLLLFIWAEDRAYDPIMPLQLFGNSVFTLSNLIVFLMAAGMFGVLMYMPLFLQDVLRIPAAASGRMMMPMTLSLVIASIIAGLAMTRSGRYKNLAYVGLAVTTAGLYLLSSLYSNSDHGLAMVYLIVVGIGLGIGMPIFNLTTQNCVEHGHLGIATATGQLFRQLGGTIGVAVMGTIMSQDMHDYLGIKLIDMISPDKLMSLPKQLVDHLDDPRLLLNPGRLTELSQHLPKSDQTLLQHVIVEMRESLDVGLSSVFSDAGMMMIVALFLLFFLQELSMHNSTEATPDGGKNMALEAQS